MTFSNSTFIKAWFKRHHPQMRAIVGVDPADGAVVIHDLSGKREPLRLRRRFQAVVLPVDDARDLDTALSEWVTPAAARNAWRLHADYV